MKSTVELARFQTEVGATSGTRVFYNFLKAACTPFDMQKWTTSSLLDLVMVTDVARPNLLLLEANPEIHNMSTQICPCFCRDAVEGKTCASVVVGVET